MSRCRPNLEHDVAERDAFAVDEILHREVDVGSRAVRDLCARGTSELEVTGDEVGVDVRFDDQLDREMRGLCFREVRADVALRVDDNGP